MWSPAENPSSVCRHLRATTIGPEVAHRLKHGDRSSGRIAAVFPSVFYVSQPTGLLCISRTGIDPGPFSVTTTAPRDADFRTYGLAVNQVVLVESRRIGIPGRLDLNLWPAEFWSPDAWPDVADPRLIARGLHLLRQCLPSDLGGTGLGGHLLVGYNPDDGDPVCLAAKASILAARNYLAMPGSSEPNDGEWAKRLIGLGTGLTPSGDDFLGGFLIGLHAIGDTGTARRLWKEIRADAGAATNPISWAFLSAAARGRGSASLHETVVAVMSGTDPVDPLARLAQLGHSSGWDALVGSVTALERVSRGHGNLTEQEGRQRFLRSNHLDDVRGIRRRKPTEGKAMP